MTAEFVLAMPAVALVLVLCLSGMQVAALQVRLQDAAAIAARASARGDSAASVAGLIPGASVETYSSGELRCARVSASPGGALAATGLRLTASSCSLGGGR